MSTSYNNVRDFTRAREFAAKAYALKERVSDRERFYIEARYFGTVTGESDEVVKVYEVWSQTYPRDYVPWNNLGVEHESRGDFEKSLDAFVHSRQLNSSNALVHGNIAQNYLHLYRLADARAAADQAIAQFPNNDAVQGTRFSDCLPRAGHGENGGAPEDGSEQRPDRSPAVGDVRAPSGPDASPMRGPFGRNPRT